MSTVVNPGSETPTSARTRRLNLRQISLILVVIGLLITGYLSYTKLFNQEVVCIGGSAGCDIVQSSAWSRFMGIPVQYLGFATYLFLGAILLLENRVGLLREYGVMIVFGVTLFGFVYQSYLTFISLTQIQASCQWCLASHLTMTILFIISARRLWVNVLSPKATPSA